MRVELIKRFTFEAAHVTPWRDDPARLHGHSFTVDLVVEGPCDEELGWLMDYADITACFEPCRRRLDHQTLNDVEELDDPSLEGIRVWIAERVAPELPLLKEVRVGIVGDQMFAPKLLHADVLDRLPERIRFGFEAAHALPRLPADHKCHTMHGHSFEVDVGAENAEKLMGRLVGVYERLDHQCLNDLPGLENPTSEEIARWIWQELAADVHDLRIVTVAETCTARCRYHGH